MCAKAACTYLLVVDEPLEDGGGVPAAALAAHPRRPARLDRQTLLRPLQKSSLSLPRLRYFCLVSVLFFVYVWTRGEIATI